ncbi:MAG TPA: lysophospholipid acyltransferase family protein [Actinomycetaceae bacterium]|nr:lysophospholipid acyltransferase family protein [Actinomycetaceae bacterium]
MHEGASIPTGPSDSGAGGARDEATGSRAASDASEATAARSRRRPAPAGVTPTRRYNALWHRFCRTFSQRLLLRSVVRSVTTLKVEGRDNISSLTRPYVMVANHTSHLDTAAIISAMPARVTRHLAVGAAADYFYSRWWIKALTSLFFNTYPINRPGRESRTGKGTSQRLLRENVPILVYPEGTRSRDGQMRPFKPGAAALSISARVPCVPVAILGARAAMPVGRFWPKPGRPTVRVFIGRPMHPALGEKPREFSERIEAQVRLMLEMQTPYVVPSATRARRRLDSQEEAS